MADAPWDDPGWREAAEQYALERARSKAGNGPDSLIVPQRQLIRLRGEAALTPQPLGTVARNILHAGSVTLFYGPPKSGKSFLVTDLLLSIAAGDNHWLGHKIVRPGPVLYVACEGHAGFWKRLVAAKIHRGLLGFPDNFELALGRPELVMLTERGRVAIPHPDAVVEAIDDMIAEERTPVAVAIDTVLRAAGAANINMPDHMAAYLAAIGAIMNRGIGVGLVHHENKAGTSPLGSIALMAGADTIIRTQNLDDGTHAWEIEFAKDDAQTEPRKFKLEVVPVGHDPDGEEASSCVVMPVAGKVVKAKPLKPEHDEFRGILMEAFAEVGHDDRPEPGMPTVKTISRDQLRQTLIRKSWFSEQHLDGIEVLKRGFTDENNALRALKLRGLIAFNRAFVWMV